MLFSNVRCRIVPWLRLVPCSAIKMLTHALSMWFSMSTHCRAFIQCRALSFSLVALSNSAMKLWSWSHALSMWCFVRHHAIVQCRAVPSNVTSCGLLLTGSPSLHDRLSFSHLLSNFDLSPILAHLEVQYWNIHLFLVALIAVFYSFIFWS